MIPNKSVSFNDTLFRLDKAIIQRLEEEEEYRSKNTLTKLCILTDNLTGSRIFKMVDIFQNKLSHLNLEFKNMCDNNVFDYQKFFGSCVSVVENIFGKKLDEDKIQKINNDEQEISLKALKQRSINLMENILEQTCEEHGVKVLCHSFKIDEEDVEKHKMSSSIRKCKEAAFDCIYYILYKIRESKFEKWLFKKGMDSKPSTEKIFDRLKKSCSVEREPKKDDIIIYMNNEKVPIHFGVFSDSHTVQSKWGSLPQIFSHPMYISPYGNNVIVFRKKVKESMQN